MGVYSPYQPGDYVRVCDLCGLPSRRSQLARKDGLYICELHPGWRTKQQLDREIARQRPFRVIPVPDAKPQDRTGPKIAEDVDGEILNLLDRLVSAGARYEQVDHGRAVITGSSTGVPQFMGWAARYCWAVISENRRSLQFIAKAKSILNSAATYLRTIQAGFGFSTSFTKSNSGVWGGISPGGSSYLTEQTYMAGFAFLHNYQVTGDLRWIESARAAASFLRNVQSIGAYKTSGFTSSDAGGTARLYTGAIMIAVSSALAGTHFFYPQALLALEFWNQLKNIDGDQQIGADGTVAGLFTAAPQKLISQAMADLRSFWSVGTYDNVLRQTVTGLSTTTPRTSFDAYPSGTGSWSFSDADASTGTTITAEYWAHALSALYSYEGASSQVTTIDDWFYTFTSNSAYELAATSIAATARSSNGTYDPAVTLSTELLVRDSANSYAATKKNASALYDWGAFGVLSALRAARHASTFRTAKEAAMPPRQRYRDGRPSDGEMQDRIYLRGKSGLGYQTAFTETVLGATRAVNDGAAAAQFGLALRQGQTVFPRSV